MGLVVATLGLVLGVLVILIGNPLQLMPRYIHPLRYVVVARWYERLKAEYRIKKPFWQITLAAAALLILWFLVGMLAPMDGNWLLSRAVMGIGLGIFLAWTLFCRHELLLSPLGIVGFYPNPRLVVTWGNLAGYLLLADSPKAFILVNKAGKWVEAIPYSNEEERQQIELALLPYLPRLDPANWPMPGMPKNLTRALWLRYILLLLATLPLAVLYIKHFLMGQVVNDIYLLVAIGLAILTPLYVFNWSRRWRLVYYSSLGHVSVAQLISLCQRCFYQAVCWHSGLHRYISWRRDNQARVPTWEEFCKDLHQQPKITPDIYHTCCQCLVGHLQAKDLYQIVLTPISSRLKD